MGNIAEIYIIKVYFIRFEDYQWLSVYKRCDVTQSSFAYIY
jgi:hypothetical protein